MSEGGAEARKSVVWVGGQAGAAAGRQIKEFSDNFPSSFPSTPRGGALAFAVTVQLWSGAPSRPHSILSVETCAARSRRFARGREQVGVARAPLDPSLRANTGCGERGCCMLVAVRVIVVYVSSPITHSLPPAVGASRTSQFMISKGPGWSRQQERKKEFCPINRHALVARAHQLLLRRGEREPRCTEKG